MSEHRLVAGIGFRRETPAEAIVALIRRALGVAGLGDRVVAIATAADRARDPAIREAAMAFGLVPVAVEAEALERVDYRVPTRSGRIERLRGVGSLAEAAALAVAGDEGRLVVARIDDGRATCALTRMGTDRMTGRVFPPPSAGEGGSMGPFGVSEGREREATSPDTSLPFPDPLRGAPSPAEREGKSAPLPDRQATLPSDSQPAPTVQIATQTP